MPSIDSLERALARRRARLGGRPRARAGPRRADRDPGPGRRRGLDPAGEPFDPAFSEAVSTRAGDGEAGTVVETLDRGYRSDGTVLRPARVVVGE